MHRRDFRTTHWSVVLAARDTDSPAARAALEELGQTYWYPLYALARRRGADPDEAQDLVQGLFARLLERRDLATVHPDKGRFRTFLSVALKNLHLNELERLRAERRGGRVKVLSIDIDEAAQRYSLEPAHTLTPEKQFDRQWAETVLARARTRLQEDYAQRGQQELHAALCPALAGGLEEPLKSLGARLGMSEAAVKVAVHRLRRRFREELRGVIAETVAAPADVADEVRHLFEALGD